MSVINRNSGSPIFNTLAEAQASNMTVGQLPIVLGTSSSFDGGGIIYSVQANGSGGLAMSNGNELVKYTGTAAIADLTTSSTDTTAGRVLINPTGEAQAFRRGNLLGTVSESSGVPTGAVIESGSGANGEYVKFADGTVVAHKKVSFSGLTLTPNASAVTVNSIMAFTGWVGDVSYSFHGNMKDSGGFDCYGSFLSYGVGDSDRASFINTGHRPTATYPQWDSVGANVATNGYYTVTAIGRWF